MDPTGTYCPVPEDWFMRKYGRGLRTLFNFCNDQ